MKKNIILFLMCFSFTNTFSFKELLHMESYSGENFCNYVIDLSEDTCEISGSLCDIINFNLKHDNLHEIPNKQDCPTLTSSSTSICSNQSVLLTAQGNAPNYTIQPGNIILITGVPQLITPQAGTTTYSITASGNCPSSRVTITSSNTPSLTVTASTNTLCNPGTVIINATGLQPGANYTLFPNNITSNTGIFTINPSTTSTYSITGSNSECCTITGEITITIGKEIIPTFNQVGSICLGGTLAPLPTTSLNGITGTWSPALNNTATTTYTFTPNAGQCAVTTNMTIVVNPTVIPTFTQIQPICLGGTLAPLPTTSLNGIAGTWTPALNNTTTTTYTFTPNAGQCAKRKTMTIVVNPSVIPNFTQLSPICLGGNLAPLPTTSLNGITGTWAPALNNTTTTTYTFTPNIGQCAVTTNMTIVVNPPVIPTFTQIQPICLGVTLASLPTTSLNGIVGTWTPALNNTTTTTYTFTPNMGQCAVTTNMTIVVNPTVIPTFTQIQPICLGGTLAPLPTTSLNGIVGTWTPALNNTATTTYTFTPNAGQCAKRKTMTIVVNPLVIPTFTQISPICLGGNLAPLPTTSLNGITGTWTPALNNTTTTTYTFTPNMGHCAVTTNITIVVNPSVIPTFTQIQPICLGGALAPLPTTSLNGIAGTWTPALNNTATTTYTFTPNAGQCANTSTMSITVGGPSISATASSTSICLGQSVILNPSGANTYTLFPGNISSNGASFILTPTQTTTYSIIGSSTDCCKGTFQITIEVKNCQKK